MTKSKKKTKPSKVQEDAEPEILRNRIQRLANDVGDDEPSNANELPPVLSPRSGVKHPKLPDKALRSSRRKLRKNVEDIRSSPFFEKPVAAERSSEARDLTSYQEELSTVKKKLAVAIKSKASLQALAQRLEKQAIRQSKAMDTLLKNSIETANDSAKVELFESLRQERTRGNGLQQKVRSLEAEQAILVKKYESIQGSIKFSNVRELKVQNRTFFNEARRLRALAEKIAVEEQNLENEIVARVSEQAHLMQATMTQDRSVLLEQQKGLDNAVSDLRNKSQRLSLQIEDEKNEKESLRKALGDYSIKNQTTETILADVRQELKQMETVINGKNSEIASQQAHALELEGKLDQSAERIAQERLNNQKLSEQLAQLEQQNQGLKILIQANEETAAIMSKSLSSTEARLAEEIDRGKEHDEISKRITSQLEMEKTSTQHALDRVSELESNLNAAVQAAQESRSKAEADAQQMAKDLSTFEGELTSERSALKMTKEQLAFDTARFESQISKLESDLDQAKKALIMETNSAQNTLVLLKKIEEADNLHLQEKQSLEEQLNASKQSFAASEVVCEASKAQVTELQTELNATKAQQMQVQSALDEARKDVESSKNEFSRIVDENQQTKVAARTASDDVNKVMVELKQVQDEYAKHQEESHAKVQELETSRNLSLETVSNLRAQVLNEQTEKESLARQLQALQNEQAASKSVQAISQTENAQLQKRIAEEQEKNATLNTELTASHAQVASMETQNATLGAQVTSLGAQVTSLGAQVTSLEAQATALGAQVNVMEKQIAENPAQATALEAQVNVTEKQIAEKSAQSFTVDKESNVAVDADKGNQETVI